MPTRALSYIVVHLHTTRPCVPPSCHRPLLFPTLPGMPIYLSLHHERFSSICYSLANFTKAFTSNYSDSIARALCLAVQFQHILSSPSSNPRRPTEQPHRWTSARSCAQVAGLCSPPTPSYSNFLFYFCVGPIKSPMYEKMVNAADSRFKLPPKLTQYHPHIYSYSL